MWHGTHICAHGTLYSAHMCTPALMAAQHKLEARCTEAYDQCASSVVGNGSA